MHDIKLLNKSLQNYSKKFLEYALTVDEINNALKILSSLIKLCNNNTLNTLIFKIKEQFSSTFKHFKCNF